MADHLDQAARAEDAIMRLRELATGQPDRYLPALAMALVNLSLELFDLGRNAGAGAAVDEALSIGRRVISEGLGDSVDRARTLSGIAAALQTRYETLGDISILDEEITMLRQALAESPEDDRNRVSLLSNLGNAFRIRFERSGAAADLAETVKLQRQAVAGATGGNQDCAALFSNLGTALRLLFEVTGDLDSLDEAVAVLRQAASTTQVADQHRTRRLSNLGAALRARYKRTGEQADLAEAESLLRHAIEELSPDESDYPVLQSNLADVLHDLATTLNDEEKRTEAEALFAAVLQRRMRVLGPDHPDTLASRNNLASISAQLGRYEQAEAEFHDLAETQRRVLGPDHPDTLASRNNLASVLAQLGRYEQAEAEFHAVLDSRRSVFGPEHPDTRTTRALLTGTQDSLAKAQTKLVTGRSEMPFAHKTILVVDIVAFGAAYRTSVDQLSLRQGLYSLLKQSLIDAGARWDKCAVEDRGDGMVILAPADVPKTSFIKLPDRLQAALHNYNLARTASTELKLRLSLHAGNVRMDTYGASGVALIHTFRLLDSAPLKQALANSRSNVAVITSNWFFNEVVRQDPTVDHAAYQAVRIEVKETSTTGWIRIPPMSESTTNQALNEHRISSSDISPAALVDLTVDALLAIPGLAEESGRRRLIHYLPEETASAIPYHSRARMHMSAIVTACLNYSGGIQALSDAVRSLDPASMPVRDRDTTVASVTPSHVEPTSPTARKDLADSDRLGQLIQLGTAQAMRWWKAGRDTPGSLPYLNEAIATLSEAHQYQRDNRLRGHVGGQLGLLLTARFAQTADDRDRETGISMLEEALAVPNLPAIQRMLSRVGLGTLYLGKVLTFMQQLDSPMRMMTGQTPPEVVSHIDRAVNHLREVLADGTASEDTTGLVREMLGLAETLQMLVRGTGLDLQRLMNAMTGLQKMKERFIDGDDPSHGSTSPAFLSFNEFQTVMETKAVD